MEIDATKKWIYLFDGDECPKKADYRLVSTTREGQFVYFNFSEVVNKSPNSKRFELEQRKTEALEDANRIRAIEFILGAETVETADKRKKLLVDNGIIIED